MEADTALNQAIRALGPHAFLACWSDGDDWFSPHELVRRGAARLCGGCPVRMECLAAAVVRDEQHGVWGGVEFPLKRAAAPVPVPSVGDGR